MLEFNKEFEQELSDLIRYDNAVLFLGQNYQLAFGSENTFAEKVNLQLCRKQVSNLSYTSLWTKMSELSSSSRKEGGHPVLDDEQKIKLAELGISTNQNSILSNTLNVGWASVITSAIDAGIINTEGVDCNPIYNVNTRPAGIANKKKLHVTYLYGCVTENGSFPISHKIRGKAKDDAKAMYARVIDEAIPYSGALVIDGWDPVTDWASIEMVLGTGKLDPDMLYPKIFLFGCSTETKAKLYEDESTEELAESDKLIVTTKHLYECMQSFVDAMHMEAVASSETLQLSETISFQRGKKSISISIPREALRTLDPEKIHLLLPKDRVPVAFDANGLRDLTIRFLANSNEGFPYWQGYLHGCCFERDSYKNFSKTGLYDKTLAALQAQNLHKVKNVLILNGPSNSGKTVLLGQLALELSYNYPVLFIKGEIEADDPEITRFRYETLITFINTYLTRNPQNGGKIRAVIIWDNDAFIDKLQNYLELAKELSESNVVLVGSAYEIRDTRDNRRPTRGVDYIPLSPVLNPINELPSMEQMLAKNLGNEFMEALINVRNQMAKSSKRPDLIHDENRILSLLQRTFRQTNSETVTIVDEAVSRADREVAGTEQLMTTRFSQALQSASENYNTDINGLAEILEQCTKDDQKDEEWYRQLSVCAPTLNDMLALAGQFGIRLPLNLVKRVLCDTEICPDIKYHMEAVDDILSFDTMLEYPFPVDDVGHLLVGYRSPDEADIYLNTHFNSRANIDSSSELDNEGNVFLEDREIYLLEKIIEYSNLEDYSPSNWNTVTTVRELLDQFGSNSRKGEIFARQFEYKYDELASFILQHGGAENPEMALCAAFLMREQIRDSMLRKVAYGYNISKDERKILDVAADGLEHAIEIENQEKEDGTPRMMRLQIEWCTNRNYALNRENPTEVDLDLFRQIHKRFSKALGIYLHQDIHRMKPMNMMDVYLNAFSYFVSTMEIIYKVESKPAEANPVKLQEYTDEISYAMTSVLGKLLDYDDMNDSRQNLNNNILKVYKLSKNSIESLRARARAHGSAAYILLYARNLWIDEEKQLLEDIQNVRAVDLYLTSDYSETPETADNIMIAKATDVYNYLKQRENLNVLMSHRANGEKEVAGLEMLIRATWISKTGSMPFSLNQFPKLAKSDWDELHKYCKAYTESGNDRARYAFAYYLEGIYYWTFTPDAWDRVTGCTPSRAKFELCNRSGIKPHGVFSSDSFIYLCELESGKPIKLNARVKRKSATRDVADITSAVDARAVSKIPNVIGRQNVFCAQSLQRQYQKNGIQSKVITIRFNLQGALAGPENPDMEVSTYAKE